MGRVFDSGSARLYEEWLNSSEGISVDRLSTELIMRLLQPKKGERVLDIGCGTGNHLLLFYRIGLDVTGLDASSYMLDIARSRLGHRASLEVGRAEDLPFEDRTTLRLPTPGTFKLGEIATPDKHSGRLADQMVVRR